MQCSDSAVRTEQYLPPVVNHWCSTCDSVRCNVDVNVLPTCQRIRPAVSKCADFSPAAIHQLTSLTLLPPNSWNGSNRESRSSNWSSSGHRTSNHTDTAAKRCQGKVQLCFYFHLKRCLSTLLQECFFISVVPQNCLICLFFAPAFLQLKDVWAFRRSSVIPLCWSCTYILGILRAQQVEQAIEKYCSNLCNSFNKTVDQQNRLIKDQSPAVKATECWFWKSTLKSTEMPFAALWWGHTPAGSSPGCARRCRQDPEGSPGQAVWTREVFIPELRCGVRGADQR